MAPPSQEVKVDNTVEVVLAHKAVVIRLKDEPCERLIVEVQDPEGVVERINQAGGVSS